MFRVGIPHRSLCFYLLELMIIMKTVLTKNSGFSLVEILISLVVMSIGMMGLAGLKMVSIKGTNEAHFRHEGSLVMMDLADRMRSNIDGVDAGSYESASSVSLTAPTVICTGTTSCTSAELAAYDNYQVATNMSQAIPESTITITCPGDDCTTLDDVKKEHTITISWKVRKDKSEDLTMSNDTNDNEYHIREIELTIVP